MKYWKIKHNESIRPEYRGKLLYKDHAGYLRPATRSCAVSILREGFHRPVGANSNHIDVFKRGYE